MDREQVSKTYPPNLRMVDYGQFSYYYAYGNRPAEDLLEYVHPEDEKAPTILSLGCGDPRSFLYTLWKHFTPSLSERHFSGARFILNDISAGVLARNILFLYLAVKIPPWTQRETAKQWISNMWAIWYCHELLPIHEKTLKEALTTLLKLSDTMKLWEESQLAIAQLVSFTDDSTRVAIRRMWEMWNVRSFKMPTFDNVEVANLYDQRYVEVTRDWHQMIGLSTYTTKAVREAELKQYARNLSAYAEECLNLPCTTGSKIANPTLFEREDGSYTMPLGSSPFVCFHHGLNFSKSQIQMIMGSKFTEPALIVEDDAFLKYPLLSNSVQQFSMWVSSSAATLIGQVFQRRRDISFTLNCSDCLVFCDELQKNVFQNLPSTFDTIFTSNLIDHLPPPVLMLVVKPLLKMTSYLLSCSFHYRRDFSSAEQYLTELFGFSPSLLPLLCGIRCVGHDGEYADCMSIIPLPLQLQHLLSETNMPRAFSTRIDKVLIWQRVKSQPILINTLEGSFLSDPLHGTLLAQIMYLYKVSGDTPGTLCTETAVNTILSFVSQLDSGVDIGKYTFWGNLCSLVRSTAALHSFLVHIQTQSLLHGLHFHFTLSDTDCPICLKKPLEEYISQFSIKFDPLAMNKLVSYQGVMPMFVVFIHKARVLTDYDQLKSTDHIVDSAQGLKLACGKLRLSFFFPAHFVEEGYFYTVVRYVMKMGTKGKEVATPVAFLSGELCQAQVPYRQDLFYFKQAGVDRSSTNYTSSSLGPILSHVGDNDHMETVLSLEFRHHAFLSAKTVSIKFEHPSPSTIRVVCGKYNLMLALPYPVNYSKIKAQVSHSQGIVQLSFPREKHRIYDEKRFITSPSQSMLLPEVQLSEKDFKTICDFQYTKEERNLMRKDLNFLESFPKLHISAKVRINIQWMFILHYNFFTYVDRDDSLFGCILIHRRAVEIQRCTPVLDVFYLPRDDALFSRLGQQWYDFVDEVEALSWTAAPMDETTWLDLTKALMYFARRTPPTSKNLPNLLCRHGLENLFTRIILYPLYCDQDYAYEFIDSQFTQSEIDRMNIGGIQSPLTSHSTATSSAVVTESLTSNATKVPVQDGKGCSYCGRKSDKLEKCTECGEAWYCDEQCQAGHRKEHKKICKLPVKELSKTSVNDKPPTKKCLNCGICKKSAFLKRCAACHIAIYCSKECQRDDWKRHKLDCTGTKSLNHTLKN